NGDIYVSTDVGPPEIISLWGGYGVKLTIEADRLGHDDFAAELAARTYLADEWKKERTTTSARDPYLDTLVAVRDAGFMREYVLAFLTGEGWTVPGSDFAKLDIAGFSAWAAAPLPASHAAVTRVKIILKAPTQPTVVPGVNLVRPGEIDPQHTECANLRAVVDRAAVDWIREARALPAVPLSVMTRAQILPSLKELGADPRAHRDGVVFVS